MLKPLKSAIARVVPACVAVVVVSWLGLTALTFASAGDSEHQLRRTAPNATCHWASGFGLNGLDDDVYALTVFDDGTGPALYAAGDFDWADDTEVTHIARWRDGRWSALTSAAAGFNEPNSNVYSLAVFDDGDGPALYAGGYFDTVGGATVNNVARWNGVEWLPLVGPSGVGASGSVSSLAVYDDGGGTALYACGSFTMAGGVTVHKIAKWDGAEWSALTGSAGTGFDEIGAWPWRFAVFDDGSGPGLYVGGGFDMAGGVTANGVARWDGGEWSGLTGPSGTGVQNGSVRALAVFDDGTGPALFVGGYFDWAGGVHCWNAAKWDGSEWSALTGPTGTGTDDFVDALATFDDGNGEALYLLGYFTHAGGLLVNHVARWTGAQWSGLAGGSGVGLEPVMSSGTSGVFQVYDDGVAPALIVGGEFELAGGVPARNIASWNGSSWGPVTSNRLNGMSKSIFSLATLDLGGGPRVVAGGVFRAAGTARADYLAAWDGSRWSAVTDAATGLDAWVYATTAFDDGSGPALFVGGVFDYAGGTLVNSIAKWDGSVWSALPGPTAVGFHQVRDLAVFDDGTGPALYVAGYSQTAGGVTVNNIARWDGVEWSPLTGPSGTGTDGSVYTLEVFDGGAGPALYAGGDFDHAGGVSVDRIARWDGLGWEPLTGPFGTGVIDTVNDLEVFDDGDGPALYVGGDFQQAGGVPANFLARWDGDEWALVHSTGGAGLNGPVAELRVFDDGTGGALYAGGEFTTADGIQVNRVARWDGAEWSGLSGPSGVGIEEPFETSLYVGSLEVLDLSTGPQLIVGGTFMLAGGVPSSCVAAWVCLPPTWIFGDDFETGNGSAWSATVP